MTDHELFALPKGVRELFQSIPDSKFDDDHEIRALRKQLDHLEKLHRRDSGAHRQLHERVVEFEQRRDACRLEVRRLSDTRPGLIAGLIASGADDLAADREVVEQIAKLQHFVDAVDLAKSALEAKLRSAASDTRLVVNQQDGIEDQIRGVLDRLKLAEAERQYHA